MSSIIMPPPGNNNALQQYLSIVLEAISEGVIMIDAEQEILFLNERSAQMFGYKMEELIGQKLDKLLPVRYRENHRKKVASIKETERVRPMGAGIDFYGIRNDGVEFPVEVGISSLTLDGRKYKLAFISDITRQKQTEQELQDRNQALDTYARTVAHDLNSMISVIVGMSELLLCQDHLPLDRQKEYLQRIANTGWKMSNILEQILLYARTQLKDIKLSKVNMGHVIKEVSRRLTPEIRDRIAVIQVQESFPNCWGQPAWIEEVWFNYLNNALKYGGTPPKIRMEYQYQEDGYIRFDVIDNGQGIEPEIVPHLFDPESDIRKRIIKGHGIGLGFVKKLVDRMGGRVEVESQPKQGSRFSFYLPENEPNPPEGPDNNSIH